MKPILWVLSILCIALLADLALSAPQGSNDDSEQASQRIKRASRTGQTQSQYLNFGDSQTEGKADAEITRYGSRASVSGSNGMGQAQSQSSGSGCEGCYGSEGGYSHGGAGGVGGGPGPDPLRSASGSSHGLPIQSQTSSGVQQPGSATGYDIYGRPIVGGSALGPSGYDSRGFGPASSRSPSDRIKDAYNHVFPSGLDAQQPGAFGNNGFSSPTASDQTGVHGHNGKTPSNLGSTSFLNRPITNGRPSGWQIDTTGGSPSILMGRKTGSNVPDAGTSGGGQPGAPTGFGSSHDGTSTTNGRSPSNRAPGSNLPSYSQINGGGAGGSPDTSSSGRTQPIRSGAYDTPSRSPTTGTGLQPIDQSRKQPADAYGKTHRPGYTNGENGSSGPSGAPSATDALDGLRNVFKLPPGLCLVRCDTLRPGQSLTADQMRDAIESSGQPSKYIQPQIGTPSSQFPQSVPTSQLPQGGYAQYPTTSGSQIPSGSQVISPGQTQPGPLPYEQGAGQTPTGAGSLGPSYITSQPQPGAYPQGAPSSFPAGQIPTQAGTPSVQYPSTYQPTRGFGGQQFPSPLTPTGVYQQAGINQPTGGAATGTGGAPSSFPAGQISTQAGSQAGQYPQGGVPSGQLPQGGVSSAPYQPTYQPIQSGGAQQYPSPLAPTGVYQQPGITQPTGGAPIGTGVGTAQYPTGYVPSPSQTVYPQGGVPSSQLPQGGIPSVQYPQGGVPTSQLPQTVIPSGQYPQGGLPAGVYPQAGGLPTSPGTISAGAGAASQSGAFVSGPLPQTTGGQYPSGTPIQQQPTHTQGGAGQFPQGGTAQIPAHTQGTLPGTLPQGQLPGGYAQYPTTSGSQIPSGSQVISPGQTQPGFLPYQQGQTPTGAGSLGPSYIPTQSQPGAYPQGGGAPTSLPSGQISTQAGSQTGQYPQGGIPTSQFPQGGVPSGQYQPTYQPIQSGGGQQYPSSLTPTGVYQQPGITQTTGGAGTGTGGAGSGTIASGGYTQSGGQAQYPIGYVPSPNQAVYPQGTGGQSQGIGQGQLSQPTTGGAGYLPQQYPTPSTGGYGGVPTYQTPGYTGQVGYRTGYPGAIDSTAAQTGQGVPANYVSGGTTSGLGTGLGDSETSSGGASGGEEDGFSQAESSIKNGEIVSSAQGTKNGGTAQTNVQGTYSGSGSFSASAQTADKDRSAQAQVSGNKDGALSSSQGSGGKSQAQAQVQVDEKTGGTSASGQTSGLQHSSQSEVTANEKGGLADAQSSGPGQTSSQAQIGFKPESASNSQGSNIFNGGGQASAQSGVHSGQSQSQIQGNFKYGISYHGAAQAASGTKEQVTSYREKSKKLFQSIGQFSRSNRDAVTSVPVSDIANINDIGSKPKQTSFAPEPTPDTESELEDEDYNADEGGDEYDGDYENGEKKNETNKQNTKSSRMQVELPQRTVLDATSGKSKETVSTTEATPKSKTTKLVRMPAVRSEIVPDGFKGKIEEKRQKHNLTSKNQLGNEETKVDVKPDIYVTVTKSVSGSLDNAKATPTDDKKFESTYYTKSSTCGYFTFSCNIVYGSNGRSKICRPKQPTNGKC
ncbi:hornerin isoform X3 [Sitodiplosis mosellana]|uniref:hornerin isoform X3 n=1 Tax=Sitodiplosis mosellana TaxID=263140 RepID=UPI0024441D12|nr:hornerin isoform X3 [Sitodiplosis mosellana]